MAYTFPTLSRGVSIQNFSEEVAEDPTLRDPMDDGLTLTRPGWTKLKQKFKYQYSLLLPADKVLLKAMQTSVKVGSGEIDWSNPDDDVTYTVLLTKPIRFQIDLNNHNLHTAMIEIVES